MCAFYNNLLISASEECLDPTEVIVSHSVAVQLMQQLSVWYLTEGLRKVEKHHVYLFSLS